MAQPLFINTPEYTEHPYTIVIYWKKRTGIDSLQNGHSALIIDSSRLNMSTSDYYVSWLSGGGKSKSLGTKFVATQASF